VGKLLIQSIDAAPAAAFPELAGVSAAGDVRTRAVVEGPDRPLFLWRHDLAPGAAIAWDAPAHGHLVYLWRGEAAFEGAGLEGEDALIVEPGGRGSLAAGRAGATLLHFFAPVERPEAARAGGGAHVLRKKALTRHFHPQTTITLYADASCEGCDLWLHSGESPAGMQNFVEEPHSHSKDEIIVVVAGSLLLGPNRHGTGTALAIDADTVYSFAVKEDALHFVNFRAGASSVTTRTPGGKLPPRSEREFITALPTSPL
jgi:hypothetical protein